MRLSKSFWLLLIPALIAWGDLAEVYAQNPCRELPVVHHVHASRSRRERPSFTVSSLNFAQETSLERVVRDLKDARRVFESDLLLLQEVEDFPDLLPNVAGELANTLHFDYLFAPSRAVEGSGSHGLAILSRYPLRDIKVIPLERILLRYHTRCRVAVAATVDTPLGSLRVFNVHLDTRINADRRWAQLIPVVSEALDFDGPVLVGGDFNTQNVYWVANVFPVPFVQRQAQLVREKMESLGFKTPFVHTGPTHDWAPLKLDWMFFKGLVASGFGVARVDFSDHRAIWAEIKREPSALATH